MTAPEEYTRQQAADPATPQQVLADIAALRPDLRPVVALNPSAYPGLLDWLGTLGEPGVDTALGQRRDREVAAAGGVTAPDGPATRRDAQDGPAPWTAPEATSVGTAPATMPVPAGGPFTAPAGGGPVPGYAGGGYAGGGYAGTGGPGQPHGGFGGGQAGRPGVGQAGFPPPGATGGSGSRKTLWIVLGVLGALLVAGVVVVLVVVNLARGVAQDLQEGGFDLDTLPGETYGDNAELDALWDACADGDMVACDDLYSSSGLGTEYERFGDTCGGQTDGGAYCAGSDTGSGTAPGSDAGTSGTAYGDDPALDALWDACAAEDLQACDDLYFDSPSGSEYEDFGDTCGGRTEGGSLCAPDGADAAETYGDDPELDALWDACAAGDLAACDDLYFSSGLGTEYEEFGQTCGRTRDGAGLCAP